MKTLKNFAVGTALFVLLPASIFAEADIKANITNKKVKQNIEKSEDAEVEVEELNIPILSTKKPADIKDVSYSSIILKSFYDVDTDETSKTVEETKETKDKKESKKNKKKKNTKKKAKKKSKKQKKKKLIGNFKITAYCIYGRTASGTTTTPNRTIAADPSVLPYGTEVIINGQKYVVEDTGGAIRNNRIDIYMSTYNEAINWGVRNVDVYYAN